MISTKKIVKYLFIIIYLENGKFEEDIEIVNYKLLNDTKINVSFVDVVSEIELLNKITITKETIVNNKNINKDKNLFIINVSLKLKDFNEYSWLIYRNTYRIKKLFIEVNFFYITLYIKI
jgi:hypothetical protein